MTVLALRASGVGRRVEQLVGPSVAGDHPHLGSLRPGVLGVEPPTPISGHLDARPDRRDVLAEDLGTWPPEQATVLVEALQQAGLSPEARRTREGIMVTVPVEQSDDAHRTLVSNMDAIARAARPPTPSGGRRRRPRPAAPTRTEPSAGSGSAMGSERMLRFARPLGLLLLVVLLASIVRNPLVVMVAVAALVYWLGRQAQRRGDGDGDDEQRRW